MWKTPESEDIGSVVIESGSTHTRIGYSGDLLPKHSVSTLYGKLSEDQFVFGEAELSDAQPSPNLEIYNPMSEGCVQDWEATIKLWRYLYSNKLRQDPREQPLMTVEPVWNMSYNRCKALEAAFEDLSVPAFNIGKSPLCIAFGAVRPTSLIVEVGSSCTSVVPVVDGTIMTKGVFHTRFAGEFLNLHILNNWKSRGLDKYLYPPSWTPQIVSALKDSFKAYYTDKLIDLYKECTSLVSEFPFTAQSPHARSARPFSFPKGQTVPFGAERLSTVESLFNPKQFVLTNPLTNQPMNLGENPQGIGELLYTSVTKTSSSPDLQASLLSNIVLAGGTTLLTGFTARLANDIGHYFPNYRARIHEPPSAAERKASVWTGASILASMSLFDTWVTKQEYEELGLEACEKKFK